MSEEAGIIELMDDEGNVMKFEHLLTFEVEDQFFVAFTPTEKFEEFDVGEVLIMRIEEDENDEDMFVPIETEEELDKLWEIFQQLYYEEEEEEPELQS
ncbi:MAG: DUF1292 domain-containing protein [Christensenellaceae bacterium]|jgi:uncharacterized protein YrzB (UPF0473 family)